MHIRTPLATVGLVAMAGACTKPVDKPDPPDTRALLAAYRTPSAPLTDDNASRVKAALDAKVLGLSTLCGFERTSDVLCDDDDERCGGCAGLSPLFAAFDSLRGGMGDADAGAGGALEDEVEGDGYVRITRICPGHGEPSPDPAHGSMELVVNFSEQGFDPVLFGRFSACQLAVLGQPLVLDAELSVTFDDSWGFDGFDRLRPVVSLAGELTTSAGTAPLDTDLELGLGASSALGLSCEVEEQGNVVFFQDGEGAGFRASNGRFLCDFVEGTCESDGRVVTLD